MDNKIIYKFTVKSVDYDIGICEVDIHLPNGGIDTIVINPYQIAVTNDDTEAQLMNTILQIVDRRMHELYPPEPPKPAALLGMVGRMFTNGDGI